MVCVRQELQSYLRKGIQLDELWRVARGEIQYKEFSSSQNGNGAVAAPPSVPEELVRFRSGLLLISKHNWVIMAFLGSRGFWSFTAAEGLYCITSNPVGEWRQCTCVLVRDTRVQSPVCGIHQSKGCM